LLAMSRWRESKAWPIFEKGVHNVFF